MASTTSPTGGDHGTGGSSVLTKEVQGGCLRASLCVWVSGLVSLVSLLFHLIAFSIVDWGRAGELRLGLWQLCLSGVCVTFNLGDFGPDLNTDGYRCVQAFAVISLLLMIACLCLTIALMYMNDSDSALPFELGLIAAHGTTAVCLIIAFAVWSGEIVNKQWGLSTGGAFGLEVVCFLLEIAAAVALFMDYLFVRKRRSAQ